MDLNPIPEVFYYAQKAVLHPTAPLFDQEAQTLKPRCVRAMKRIFILCDSDRDGALSDAELNDFQVKCFNAPLQPSEIVGVKRVVQEKLPEGVNENGLTLMGFLFLHALFIEKGRLETIWTVLRKFGYSNEIRLSDDLLLPPIKRNPDQVECDELAQRAEVLKEENASPRAEVSRVKSEYEQLLAQNATLKERLGEAPGKDDMRSGRNEQHMGNENQQSGQTEEHVQSGH